MYTPRFLEKDHDGKDYFEMRGLSTDDKPTENVANGSVCIEMDTSTMYMFDEENNEWRPWA